MTAPLIATSYSSISSLLQCGEAYRLRKIDKVSETPAVYLLAGHAFHAASELIDNNAHAIEATGQHPKGADWEELHKLALEQLDTELDAEIERAEKVEPDHRKWLVGGRGKEDIAFWRIEGAKQIDKYIEWRASHKDWAIATLPDGKPAVEVGIRPTIAGKERVGYVDRVFEVRDQANSQLVLVDMKSGTRTPDTSMQLELYKLGLEQLVWPDRKIWWGAFYMSRSNKARMTELIDLAGAEQVIPMSFAMADQMIANDIFIPKPTNGFPCMSCTVRTHCRFVRS